MNNSRQRASIPRTDGASDKPPSEMAHRQRQLPDRNREKLIRQFQRIDGSTRTDAEQQIDAYERSFLSVSASARIPGK